MSRPFADVFLEAMSKSRQPQPQMVRIRQREYKHDTAVITINYENPTLQRYKSGKPIIIRFGWLPDNVEYFHGYIHHTELEEHKNKPRELHIICVGASYRMTEINQQVYFHKNAMQIAAEIARNNHFSLIVAHETFIHEHLSTRGRSDWEFMVWLAKRHGLTVYANKTDIRLVRRYPALYPTKGVVTFYHRRGMTQQRGALRHFHNVVSELGFDEQKRTNIVLGIDKQGKTVHRRQQPDNCKVSAGKHMTKPIKHKVSHKRPVHSIEEALSVLQGDTERNAFHIQATAEVSGDVRVHQGSTVRLSGIDSDNNGAWYVTGVDHVISRTDYHMELDLGRNGVGDDTPTTNPTTSFSGKPIIVDDCDPDLTASSVVPPGSIFQPVDDCEPVEDLSELPPDQGGDPIDDSNVPVTVKPPTKKRRPCHCCTKQPKSNRTIHHWGWRASVHIVRVQQ